MASLVIVLTNTIFLQMCIARITANFPNDVGGATGNLPVMGFGCKFNCGFVRYIDVLVVDADDILSFLFFSGILAVTI
jgi:hypothetical protein